MRVRQESRLNRSRKIAGPSVLRRAEKLPDGRERLASGYRVRSEWRGEDIAHARLSKGVTFNDRKLIIFRCASSYSPSRSKLKLFQRVMGLTS
jgi:hypothetical protein